MRTGIIAGFFVVTSLLTAGASYGADQGPYISGSLGLSQQKDADITGTGINTTVDTQVGYGFAGAVGNAFGNGMRGEVEVDYRKSSVDSVGSTSGSGNISGIGLMFNGYYDFDMNSAWTPYVGVGFGRARLSYHTVSPVGGSSISDSDSVFAYQAIGGASYKLSPQLDMFGEYRYFGSVDPDLRTASGVNVDADYGEHRVMVGLRWFFDSPKPAPAPEPVPVVMEKPVVEPKPEPAPAPAPKPEPVAEVVRNYLVFFDWDQSVITPDARAILAEVVQNSKDAGISRIVATGHADRSGTDRYNLGLSQRRAQSVSDELVRLGVPVSNIQSDWKGERDPLVATEDGVREPQNRRVEIVFN